MSEIFRESKQQRREFSSQKERKKVNASPLEKGIADALGEFYRRLYEDSEKDDSEHEMSDDKRILEITTEELQSAISKLKTDKISSNGIRAEDVEAWRRRDERNDETNLQRDHKRGTTSHLTNGRK